MSQEQLTEFNGPSHEQNSLGGIPVGPSATVEGNETLQSDAGYVYSDRNVLDKETANEFRLPSKWIGKTFAEASKLAVPKSGRTDDSIEQQDTARKLDSLREAQEAWKAKELEKDMAMMQEKHPEAMAQLMQAQQAPPQQSPQDPNAMQQGVPQETEQSIMQNTQQMPPEMMQNMQQQGAPQGFAMGGFINQNPGPGDPPKRSMPEEYANLQFVGGAQWDDLTPTQQEAVHYQMNQKQWYDESSNEYKPYPGQSSEGQGAGTKLLTDANGNQIDSYNQYIGYNSDQSHKIRMATTTNPIIGGMDKTWDKQIRIPAQALKPQIGLGTSDLAMGGYMGDDGPDDPPTDVLGGNISNPVPLEYRAEFTKNGLTMPDNAVLSPSQLATWNETGKAIGWESPVETSSPVTGIPQPAQIKGVGLSQPVTVPYTYRKGSYYDQYGKPLPRESAPALAGGGFVQGLGSMMQQGATLAGNIPVFGQAIGAGLGAVGAGLQNVGTGADFKEVAKDVAFGAAKGATGIMGNALIGTAEGLVNNNTLDASEQQAMMQQKALDREEYNKENPNVAIGGIPTMSMGYGGMVRKPYAVGGYIEGEPEKPLMATDEYPNEYVFGAPYNGDPLEYLNSSLDLNLKDDDEEYDGHEGEPEQKNKTEEEKTEEEKPNNLDFTPTPLEMAGRLSPIGYNLIQGLRPSDQLNYKDFQDTSMISRHDPLNLSPYTQGLNEQYQMALSSSGRTPAQAQALMNTANKNLGSAFAQKEQFDAGQQQSYEQRLQSQNVQNLQTKAGITDMNQRAEAARRAHLGETFKQAADLSNAGRQDKLSIAMLKEVAPDYAGSITVKSYQDMFKQWYNSELEKKKANNEQKSYLKGQDKKAKS